MSFLDAFLKDKGCTWYCDNCGVIMNSQPGFTTEDDEWTCSECGAVNDVSEDNIVDDDDDDDYDDDDDDEDTSERLSVYDAALIYHSNGCDEDYMFGYSDEELRQAFNGH